MHGPARTCYAEAIIQKIKDIILKAGARNGDAFAVVAFTEGGFGISRNGIPIPDLYWESLDGGVENCVFALTRMACTSSAEA